MFNVNTIAIKDALSKIDSDILKGKRLLSVAVGLQSGRSAALPSGELEASLDEFYLTNVREGIRNYINSINEQVIIDVEEAEEFAKRFWMCRYNLAYSTDSFLIAKIDNFDHLLDSMSQSVLIFSVDQRTYMIDNAVQLINLINLLTKK